MNIPFLFFEMDFDAENFKKHYGSIKKPGIYAIPDVENETDKLNDIDKQEINKTQKEIDDEQNKDSKNNTPSLNNNLQIQQDLQRDLQQFDQDTLAIADKEIEPIKKIFLLSKLTELNTLLKKQNTQSSELETIIKFGSSLSYNTLKILAISTIQQIYELFRQQQEKEQQENQVVQN